jgi:Protein of unknown function (DUF2510)
MTQPAPQAGWYPDPSGTPGQRYWDGQKWGPKAPAQQQPQVVIYNTNTVATPPPVYVSTGPNHALHFVLTLLTCGMWLPVWIIVAIIDAASRPRGQQSGKGGLIVLAVIGSLMLLGFITAHPMALIPLAIMALAGGGGYMWWRRDQDLRAIAARADAEYRASLKGNPAGTYGQYPPPSLPPLPPNAGQ